MAQSSRFMTAALCITCQFRRQVIEHQSDSTIAAQVGMHRNPSFHGEYQFGMKHGDEIAVSPCDAKLACPDAETRTYRRELREIAIRAKREHVAGEGRPHRLDHPRIR